MLVKYRDIQSDPDGWRRSCQARGIAHRVDEMDVLDQRRKQLQCEYDGLAYSIKSVQHNTPEHRKLSSKMDSVADQRKAVEAQLKEVLSSMPNWVAEDTPAGTSDADNVEVGRSGECAHKDFCHQDAIGYARDVAVRICGARMSVFRGELARLELALTQWMLDEHISAGFEYVSVPAIVTAETMYNAGKLPKFADDAYSMEGGEKWLISTSEIPLVCLEGVCGATQRFVACTPCFRREAGAAGKDTRGWVRQHQFTKVELVMMCDMSVAQSCFEEICGRVKHILDCLGLTWRSVRICGGDLGAGAYKQVDFEVWLAGQGRWLEVSSVSDCRTYQSARLGIKTPDKSLACTLNGTGGVPGRLMAAILEQHYSEGEVVLPGVLAARLGQSRICVR